ADLYGLNRHVFKQATGLVIDELRGKGMNFFSARRVAHDHGRSRAYGMATERGTADCVGRKTAGARRVEMTEQMHDRGRIGKHDVGDNDGQRQTLANIKASAIGFSKIDPILIELSGCRWHPVRFLSEYK